MSRDKINWKLFLGWWSLVGLLLLLSRMKKCIPMIEYAIKMVNFFARNTINTKGRFSTLEINYFHWHFTFGSSMKCDQIGLLLKSIIIIDILYLRVLCNVNRLGYFWKVLAFLFLKTSPNIWQRFGLVWNTVLFKSKTCLLHFWAILEKMMTYYLKIWSHWSKVSSMERTNEVSPSK